MRQSIIADCVFLQYMKHILGLVVCVSLLGCGGFEKSQNANTKLVYFGFENHSEKQKDAISLAKTWGGGDPPCAHWRFTIRAQDADYRVLFGDDENVTIVDRRGAVLYSGGQGVLYLPHGNPDGTGVNLCKLTSGGP
jgi:hypothetical protein